MGSRGNIKTTCKDGKAPIWFYTHWQGHKTPELLQKALQVGQSRWDDESYLNRIIFQTMVALAIDETTGFGISTIPNDFNNPDVVVDHDKKEVYLELRDYNTDELKSKSKRISFKDFIEKTLNKDDQFAVFGKLK